MRAIIRTATALALLPIAACGSGGGKAAPSQDPPAASAPAAETASPAASTPDLGTPARTTGAAHPAAGVGGGILEITPTSVVYTTTGAGQKPTNGLFATVAYKARSLTAVAAAEAAPIEGGGWQWIAPDGQAVNQLDGNTASVTPDGFTSAGPVQPGSFQWRSVTIDLTPAQRGGTLVYTDGGHTGFHWKVSAQDSGPDSAKLKKALD